MTLISPWYCWRFRNQTVEGKVVYLLFTRFQHHSRWWSPGFLNHQRCCWFPGRLTTVYACVSSRRGWDPGKLILQNHMAVFGAEALKSSSFKLMFFTSNGSDERTWCMWWFLWPSPNLVRLAYASSEQGLRLGLSSHVKVQDCTATCVSLSGIHGPVMPTRTVQPLYWSSWTQANCWSRWTMATRRSLMRGHARWLVRATSKEYQALHFEIKESRHQRDTLEIDRLIAKSSGSEILLLHDGEHLVHAKVLELLNRQGRAFFFCKLTKKRLCTDNKNNVAALVAHGNMHLTCPIMFTPWRRSWKEAWESS